MSEPASRYVPGAPLDSVPERTPDATAPAASGERPGARLVAERKAQGLSLGDVARQLKLSVRQVEALERDDYAALPGMVFVRGFLRNYAKLLQLEPEPLLAMTAVHAPVVLEPAAPSAPPEPGGMGKAARPGLGWLVAGVVLAVLVVAAIFEGRQRETPAPSAGRSSAPTAEGVQRPDSPLPSAGALAPNEPAAPAASSAGAASTLPGDGPPTSPDVPGAASGADTAQVKLSFEAPSWVEVKDKSGNVIFSQLNGAGTEEVVSGQAPLTVVIGNAHGVRLTYRDRLVDLAPHTRVDVARVVLE